MNRVPFADDADPTLQGLLSVTEPWKGTAASMAGILSRNVIRKWFQLGVVPRFLIDNDDSTKTSIKLEFDLQVLKNANKNFYD